MEVIALRVPAEAHYLAALRAFVGRAAHELGLDDGLTTDLRQAASEVAAGLVEGGAAAIQVTLSAVAGQVTLLVATPVPWRDVDGFDRLDFLSALLPDGAVDVSGHQVTIRVGS